MTSARAASRALTIDDLRLAARRRLPRAIFEVVDAGQGSNTTATDNVRAFSRWAVQPRGLIDVTSVDTTCTILGTTASMPVMLAPCALTDVFHPGAETAVARAAGAAGTVYVVPNSCSRPLGEVRSATHGGLWFQVYLTRDRAADERRIRAAAELGHTALVVSVDTPRKPFRVTDIRNGLELPMTLTPGLVRTGLSRPAWALSYLRSSGPRGFSLKAPAARHASFADTITNLKPVTIEDLEWLRGIWPGLLVAKGIMDPHAAARAEQAGVDAVVVSNHGGRNLDGTQATLDALPGVVASVTRATVLVDGGVRTGTDVLKALALGAHACLVGRPYVYGLAAAGEVGVARALAILHADVERAFAFAGVRNVSEARSVTVARVGAPT